MKRKVLSGLLLTMTMGLLTLAFNIQTVKASASIYIRPDGSVEGTDKILRDGDIYIFTDSIYDKIRLERDNIVLNGAGYTLQGMGAFVDTEGIDMSGRSNVTIVNMQIKDFSSGINLWMASNNAILGNNITNNLSGISMQSSLHNVVSGNNITDNLAYGISLRSSSNNTISANNMKSSSTPWSSGISIWYSSNNTVSANNITNNTLYGVDLWRSSGNVFHGNTIDDNEFNLFVGGDRLDHFLHSIDVSNLANGQPVYYIVSQKDLVINALTHPRVGYFALIDCSNITVEGLTLTNIGQGLLLAYTGNTRIRNNNITTNRHDGVFLQSSDNNSISGNTITHNNNGLQLFGSSNNTISENNITDNNYIGIYLRKSSGYNHISGNIVAGNNDGINLYESSNHNYVIGNNITASTHNGIAADSSSYNTVSGNVITSSGFYGIFVFKSSNSIIGNEIRDDGDFGIWIWQSFNCSVSVNNIASNSQGIRILDSFNNQVYGNDITNNDIGIGVYESSNNIFYHNNFVNNIQQVGVDTSYSDSWDDGYPSGGNYWSDYTGVDVDGDGIGDTPYAIDDSNQDYYPLAEPWSEPTMIKTLTRTVSFWNLHKGIENSLVSKLQGGLSSLDKEKESEAIHKLMAFINQVEALQGKELSNEQADFLVGEAQRIIDFIEE